MKYHELTTKPVTKAKRVGRGISAGQGKTAGRGTKGQGARAGYSKKPGFAGGSNPLMQKLPKLPGFRSHKIKAEVVYTGDLETLGLKEVDASKLAEAGLVSNAFVIVKLLVKGDINKPVKVRLPKASQSAVKAIEAAGGSFEAVARSSRPKTKIDKT